MGSSVKLAKREHSQRLKFGGLVCPERAEFPRLPHAACVEMSHTGRVRERGAQKMTRGGTGTWHSFAGVSQRMTLSQKRGMSSWSLCSSALHALHVCSQL